jgi:predicted nuclease of restriction endonuclease-like RecB superfamily
MLPSDLLAVWKRKGVIWPRFARLSEKNLEVADSLIRIYSVNVGEKKRVVKEFVDELEDRGFDYRFVRGLSFLLDRRSLFRCDCKVNPADLRRNIFQATEKLGLPTTLERRSRVVGTVASELGMTQQALEESLYADLDSELVLLKFDPLPPNDLLREYNVSLTQTLLFDSTELSFTASGNWQRIFYTIKKLGLIYDAYQNGKFRVKIDGPASLFKLTRRYGTSMAKLLPVVISNPEWTVEAKILWKYTNEMYDFKVESWKHRALLKAYPQNVSYDSAVEEDFAERFQALKSGWLLRREPEPVPAGKHVIIPDFSLEREGVRVYVEIVGFWTAEYLLRKIEKLKKIDADMLVAVNESLACEKLASLEKEPRLNVIYYRDKIPLAPILRHLEESLRATHAEQKGFVKNLAAVFTEPIVNYEEFAARIGVSPEAVKTALTEKPPQGYVLTSKSLVRKDKLERIRDKIEKQISQTAKLPLTEATKIAEAEGVEEVTSILETLGYKITWHGISPEKAEVLKPKDKSI